MNALNVKVMNFKQAQVNGRSNYDCQLATGESIKSVYKIPGYESVPSSLGLAGANVHKGKCGMTERKKWLKKEPPALQ